LGKTRRLKKSVIKGIIIWAANKKQKMGKGEEAAFPSSLTFNLNEPDKVIEAKNRGTKGLKMMNTEGKIAPNATPSGVNRGMDLSRIPLSLFAYETGLNKT